MTNIHKKIFFTLLIFLRIIEKIKILLLRKIYPGIYKQNTRKYNIIFLHILF